MADRPLRILQVGSVDAGGGAARVAGNLLRGYRSRGHASWLAVGRKTGDDRDVLLVPDDNRAVCRATGYAALRHGLDRLATTFPGRGWGWLNRSLRFATHPRALLDLYAGREDFEFPGTRGLLELTSAPPDIVHGHNLHGGYFDLRVLADLSRRVPTVLTLHDAWLLSGHCAHSFGCDRWKTGCGECPDLTIDPSIRRDATADNWARKRDIYANARLYVASPSRWLIEKVEQSMLAPAVAAARVIPNGVDLSVFRPADRGRVRAGLDIPVDALVVLVVASGRSGQWRDHQMLRTTAELVRARPGTGRGALFLLVGGDAAPVALLRAIDGNVRCIEYETDPRAMARHYQAADVYLHLARTDTFPSTILESLACGTPVVATAVGGIPEQIRRVEIAAIRARAVDGLGTATGVLVPAGDAPRAAEAVDALLTVVDAAGVLGQNAARDARERFDVKQQIDCYLDWYGTIIDDWKRHAASAH